MKRRSRKRTKEDKKSRPLKVDEVNCDQEMNEGEGGQKLDPLKVEINCDQVAWINDIFRRFAETANKNYAGISRVKEVARVAAMLELMEILHLEFEDEKAAGNVLYSFPEFDELRGFRGGKKQ